MPIVGVVASEKQRDINYEIVISPLINYHYHWGYFLFIMGNIKVIKPSTDFEQVSGRVIRDYDALTIGVYCKLLTFGKDWELNIKGLASCLDLSTDKVRKCIGKLEEGGYIRREPSIGEKGRKEGWMYYIYGNAVDSEFITNAGFSRVSQKPTTRITDNTEKDQDLINIPQSNNQTTKNKQTTKVRFDLDLEIPFDNADLRTKLTELFTYPNWQKKTPHAKHLRMLKLAKIANGDVNKAIVTVEQTLENDWENFYEPKGYKPTLMAKPTQTDNRPRWMQLGYPSEEEYNEWKNKKY